MFSDVLRTSQALTDGAIRIWEGAIDSRSMDPVLHELSVQLGEVAARNAAGAVLDRITAAKARKKNEETINALEEIVSDLLADKQELTLIAQALDDQLVAQRLSEEDITYITDNLLPVVEQLTAVSGRAGDGGDLRDVVGPLLSKETLTILQLIGFNFREAIGAPLTDLVAQYIKVRGPGQRGSKAPRAKGSR